MSNQFRHVIVTFAGLLLLLGPFGWAYQFRLTFRAKLVQMVRADALARGDKATANLPDDQISFADFGTELPGPVVTRIWLTDVLLAYRWLWILVVAATCYGLHLLLGKFVVVPPPAGT